MLCCQEWEEASPRRKGRDCDLSVILGSDQVRWSNIVVLVTCSDVTHCHDASVFLPTATAAQQRLHIECFDVLAGRVCHIRDDGCECG